jgi:hypothetical protein
MGNLPDFSKDKFVFVVGSGPSLSETPKGFFSVAPVVGCNSVCEYIRPTVWCTAHSAWFETTTIRYAKTENYESAFVVKNLIVDGDPRDIQEEAKDIFSESINNKINWIEINKDASAKDVIFSRDPYKFVLPQDHPTICSSGIIGAEIAVRLGARAIVVVGSDYAFKGEQRHWQKNETPSPCELSYEEYYRDVLLKCHKEFYSKHVNIPVYYIGKNIELKKTHIPLEPSNIKKLLRKNWRLAR